MSILRRVLSALALACLLQGPGVRADSSWYYEIGGAEAIEKPAWDYSDTITFTASGEVSWNYSCGKFDLKSTVSNLLADVRTAADEYVNTMVANAQAAIASLPALILQRANPALYDMFQNGLLRVQGYANAAVLDCKKLEEQIAAGEMTFGGLWDQFKQAARVDDWKVQASLETGNVVRAQQTVERNAGSNGIPWPTESSAQRAGGQGQPPIQVIGDTAVVGFNTVAGLPPRSTARPDGAAAPLAARFGNSAGFARFMQRTVGESVVTTHQDGPQQTVPGQGLRGLVDEENTRVKALLSTAVNGSGNLSPALRELIASSGVRITNQLLREVRNLPNEERDIALQRLAQEIALAKVVQDALEAYRIHMAGMANPAIASSGAAMAINRQALMDLKQSVEDLMFEKRIRDELVSQTASAILARAAQAREAVEPIRAPRDETPVLESGATRRDDP